MMIGRLILCRNQSIGQSVSFLIAYSFPCYNGRYSRRAMKELMLVMKVCLNPYSNGMLSDIAGGQQIAVKFVLILILMEHSLTI